MKYPSYEVRAPRAAFTKKLIDVCKRLDACHSGDVAYPEERYRRAGVCSVALKSLWVVGSYARGALDCGDLDLVLDASTLAHGKSTVATFLGRKTYVRVYLGTPQDNESGVEFGDHAVLVWQPGFDWRAAIAGIKETAEAGRFDREADAIPLRPEQMYMTFDQRDDVLEAHREGLVEWSFVPLESLTKAAVRDKKIRYHESQAGKDRAALMPYLQGYLNSRGVDTFTAQEYVDGVWFCGGYILHVGRDSSLQLRMLDNPKYDELVVMPMLNARGPNGLWVIRRGPNHPLVKGCVDFKGWFVVSPDTASDTRYISAGRIDSATVLEVFRTQEDGLQALVDWEAFYHETCPFKPEHIVFREGLDFLKAMSGIDAFELKSSGQHVYWDPVADFMVEEDDADYIGGPGFPRRLVKALAA